MKITKKNLPSYLLTLQLSHAGYQITHDEIIEMNETKQHLNKKWRWYEEYFITHEDHEKWIVAAIKVVKRIHRCNAKKADKLVFWMDLSEGIVLK